jgi:hypothetical protein
VQRRLLRRTEIDRASHKVVAAELKLSSRQFYRERAAAVRSIVTTPGGALVPHESEATASIPVRYRVMLLAVSAAIDANDAHQLAVATETLRREQAAMPIQLVPFVNIVLTAGDVAAGRMDGDSERAAARLDDVAGLMNDLHRRDKLTPLAVDGLAAMLSLAAEKLDGGQTDAAIALAQDVEQIAADLADRELAIRARTMLVHAYLCLPCYTDEAYARAVTAVRGCVKTMSPKTIVGSLRALASSLAELGSSSEALLLRDVAQPLVATLLNVAERHRHQLWCASIELQCGSPSRAIAIAESVRRATPPDARIWAAATITQANGFACLGQYQRSTELAAAAQRMGHRYGLQRIVGEAQLAHARNALAMNNLVDAVSFVAAAIPLLDRAVQTSTQCSAYELSYELTKDPLHAMLAATYRTHRRCR